MINFLIASIFKFTAYAFFGLIMEVKFTALSLVTDGQITEEDKKLKGYVPLWMIPVYGLLLTFIFTPVYFLIQDWSFIYRYLIWCVTISGFEALSGFLYYKWLHVRVWDYSQDKGHILKGFTKLPLVPVWGAVGLLLEQYVLFITALVPSVISYVHNFKLIF